VDGLGRKRQSFTVRYAFPSAASSRNRRHATQIPLASSSSGAVLLPSVVFTFTIPFSTTHDPPTGRPLNVEYFTHDAAPTTHPSFVGFAISEKIFNVAHVDFDGARATVPRGTKEVRVR
jgi:hypothetical protein